MLHLDFSHFTDRELKFHKENLLRLIEDFAAYAFKDWQDSLFNHLHDLYFAVLDEQDRRSTEAERKRKSPPGETITILDD